MALTMVISLSSWSNGGTALLQLQGMEMQARSRRRTRVVVLASKRFKLRKREALEDEPIPHAPSSLPLLDDFVTSSHVSLGTKTQKQTTSNRSNSVTEVNKPNGHAHVLPRSTTNTLSLDEFLKGRVDGNADEDDTNVEEKADIWEGDSTPMTAKEERKILAEARRELAELRKRHGEAFNTARTSLDDDESDESDSDDKTVDVWRGDKLEAWKDSAESSSSLELTDDEEYDEEASKKNNRKGVPAVMRCFDRAKVYVKAGDGGNGEVAFRREKFIPHGGPSGGNGGKGGNIYFEVDTSLNSLLSFRKSVHFRAGRGAHGLGKSQDGAYGVDSVIRVPPGTIVREANGSGAVLLELTKAGQRELLLPGGRGGRGNAAFKSAKNKTPQISEKGEQGASMWVELELKLVADVGIIGVPNAGKSTLLSAITAARPAIASYPFTTLLPNLGVVSLGFDATMVVADLPGLLEGAHAGYGLGHEFLRHTERCRVLIHVIDGTSPQPELEYEAVRLELQLFNPRLSSKASIVAFNKMDVPEAAERWESFRENMEAQGVQVCCMSAATLEGTTKIVRVAYQMLQSSGSSYTEEEVVESQDVAGMVKKERSAPIGEFKVVVDPESDSWYVQGAGLERFAQMSNWEYFESLQRFERVLECSGVNAELKSRGIHEGDRVFIGDMSFIWHDSNDFARAGSWSRGQRGSKHWPH